MEDVKEKVRLIEGAIEDWRNGVLNDLSFNVAVFIIINNRGITQEELDYAKKFLTKNFKNDKIKK